MTNSSKRARGGSRSGDGRGAAGAAALGVEPLAAGEVSSLTRVRAPAGTIAWWESLTPALRGYLVMEAQRRATLADSRKPAV